MNIDPVKYFSREFQQIRSGFLPVNARLPVNAGPPYISLLEVKDKCFYLQTKWAFTGIYGLLLNTADNRDILSNYITFKEMFPSIFKSLIILNVIG